MTRNKRLRQLGPKATRTDKPDTTDKKITKTQHESLIAALAYTIGLIKYNSEDLPTGLQRQDAIFAFGYTQGQMQDVVTEYVRQYGQDALDIFQAEFEQRYITKGEDADEQATS